MCRLFDVTLQIDVGVLEAGERLVLRLR